MKLYLKIPGVRGTGTDPGHEGELELLTYQPARYAFTVTRDPDAVSFQLWSLMAARIPFFEITIAHHWMRWVYGAVVITSINGDGPQDPLRILTIESIRFESRVAVRGDPLPIPQSS